MDKVQVDVGVSAQGQEMVVIVGGRRSGDGDLSGRHARGEQRPNPSHRLDSFVICRCRTDGADPRRFRRRPQDLDARAFQPGGNGRRSSRPLHWYMCRKCLEQRSPARRQFGEADDLHGPDKSWRVADAIGRRGHDVDRAQHAGRKLIKDGCFEACDGVEARMVARSRREVYPRAPSLV